MKEKTKFVCGECGYETVKWMGCCPMCGSWNTLVEVSAAPEKRSTHSAGGTSSRAVTLGSVSENDTVRVTTGIGEFDRVLGGGVVVGSTVLIGGDPGIGKSTLIMQAAGNLKKTGGVIYVSGEESKAQLKLRAVRCGVDSELLIMTETSMDAVESEVDRIKPRFLIIDSIQTMMNRELNNAAGSVTQIREATTALTRIAKQNGCAIFIIGHVTKEGALAGPRMLEHMVDTVLYFEGDRHDSLRLLRAVKILFQCSDARIDPKQSRIIVRNERCAWFDHVAVFTEILQEHLPYLIAGQLFHASFLLTIKKRPLSRNVKHYAVPS